MHRRNSKQIKLISTINKEQPIRYLSSIKVILSQESGKKQVRDSKNKPTISNIQVSSTTIVKWPVQLAT